MTGQECVPLHRRSGRGPVATDSVSAGQTAIALPLSRLRQRWPGELCVLAAAPAHHGGGQGWAALTLLALAVLIAWGVSLYIHPFTVCGRCEGSGTNRGSNGKRWGTCKRCGGARRRQRFGSRTLHRAIQSAMSEVRRTRALKREQRVAERTRNPRNQGRKR